VNELRNNRVQNHFTDQKEDAMNNKSLYNITLTLLAVLFVCFVSFSIATAQSGSASGPSYRTFQASELTVKSPVPSAAIGSKWEFQITNNTGATVNGLFVQFYAPLVHLTNYAPFVSTRSRAGVDGVEYTLTEGSLPPGGLLTIDGNSRDPLGAILNAHWLNEQGETVGADMGAIAPVTEEPLVPMPNTANVREAVYDLAGVKAGAPIVVGLPQPHGYPGAWVNLKTSKNFLRSFVDGGLTHSGIPHGLDRNDKGYPIVGEQQYLSPTVANNEFFAQLVALKLNIRMSDEHISPAGFGSFAYFEANQPYRGMLIRDIATKGDSMMTFYWKYTQENFKCMNALIGRINQAFDGPIDTISFVNELQLTGFVSEAAGTYLFSPEMAFPTAHANAIAAAEPSQFHLNQNYPNPFNPTTTISFTVDAPAVVTLKVYNELGQEVATLMNQNSLGVGAASVEFNGSNLASGTYFYRITTVYASGNRAPVTDVKKMMLVK
jgi:hypothetical protein